MLITRKEYMANSSELFTEYYLQFATERTFEQVKYVIGIDALVASKDGHFNDIKLPFNNMSRGGGWWWDTVEVNLAAAREAGEVSDRGLPSPSTHTCVGKAVARKLLRDYLNKQEDAA